MKKKLFLLLFISAFAFSISANNEPKQPESYNYQRGVELYQAEKYEDAKTWFENELASTPQYGYAYYYLSRIYNNYNEPGKALTAINNSIKYLPKKDKHWRSYAYTNRASIYAQIGDTIQAYADLAQAIKTDPFNLLAYTYRAQLYYEQGEFELSDSDFQKIISFDNENILSYMGLGRNAMEQGLYDTALSRFNYVTKLKPDYVYVYKSRSKVYIKQEKWAEAADDLIKAFSLDPNEDVFYIFYSFPEDGRSILKSKLKIQMDKEPNEALWPFCLAELFVDDEAYNEAIEYYEKSKSINSNALILKNLAQCYFKTGDYEQALNLVNSSLDVSEEFAGSITLKADILSLLGRLDECLKERDKYVSIYPENAEAYLIRGIDYMKSRKFRNAIEDFNTAALLSEEYKNVPVAIFLKGDAYSKLGNNDEAKKHYEKVIELEKDSVLIASSYTPLAYAGLGNAEKAIETMKYVMDNDTTHIAEVLYNASCIYARLGMKEEAVKYLKKTVEKDTQYIYYIQTDYDMDSLRDLPDFNEIISEENKKNVLPIQ